MIFTEIRQRGVSRGKFQRFKGGFRRRVFHQVEDGSIQAERRAVLSRVHHFQETLKQSVAIVGYVVHYTKEFEAVGLPA